MITHRELGRVGIYIPGRGEIETEKWRSIVEFGIRAGKSRHDNEARIRVLQEFICK